MDNLIICAFITMLFHYCDAEIVEVWKPQRTRGSGGFAEVINNVHIIFQDCQPELVDG